MCWSKVVLTLKCCSIADLVDVNMLTHATRRKYNVDFHGPNLCLGVQSHFVKTKPNKKNSNLGGGGHGPSDNTRTVHSWMCFFNNQKNIGKT